MAATTCVCSIAHVASRLGEDPGLLEAIVENDDNLSYGNIVSVYTAQDECITAWTCPRLTGQSGSFGFGLDELARRAPLQT